ncbi:aromatic and neutral amino acid transporter [Pelomyxa schiedti]|nr:aromatic and neutral amino acid transporter [Pelomyxa schiedti]
MTEVVILSPASPSISPDSPVSPPMSDDESSTTTVVHLKSPFVNEKTPLLFKADASRKGRYDYAASRHMPPRSQSESLDTFAQSRDPEDPMVPDQPNLAVINSDASEGGSASVGGPYEPSTFDQLKSSLRKSFKTGDIGNPAEARVIRQKAANDRRGSSAAGAAGQFIKSMLGAGILSMPKSFSLSGLWLGVFALPILTAIIMCSHAVLIRCKRAANKTETGDAHNGSIITYKDMGALTSKTTRWAVLITLCLLQLCFCTGWIIIMINNIHTLIPGISRFIQLMWLFPVLVMLSWIRYVKQLVPLSFVGLGIYVFGVMGLSYYYAIPNLDQAHYAETVSANWAALPLFLSTLLYSCGSSFNSVISCESTLKKPGEASTMSMSGFTLYAFMILSFGAVMYASGYGGCSVVLDCLPPGPAITVVKLLLTLSLLLTYPLGLNIAHEGLEDEIFTPDTVAPVRCAVRTCLVILTCAVALLFPDFSVFSILVGSLVIPIVGFVVPPFLFFRLVLFQPDAKRDLKWKLLCAGMVSLIVFGVSFQMLTIYTTLINNFV